MDAMTAISRDQRRAEAYIEYLKALADYLQEKTAKHLDVLKTKAKAVDAVRGGYGLGVTGTTLSKSLRAVLGFLDKNDRNEWAKVLTQALELRVPPILYDRLLLLSPLRGLSPSEIKALLPRS